MLQKIRQSLSLKPVSADEGWTFIEAVYSVVLLTVVFLGFTITILAFREWMFRSWGIRLVDQYANDVLAFIEDQLRVGGRITEIPSQSELRSFTIYTMNLTDYPIRVADSTAYNFSAHPEQGVFVGIGNTAPEEFYSFRTNHKEHFPPDGWGEDHNFKITGFKFVDWNNPMLSPSFNDAMPQVILNIEYSRKKNVKKESIEYILKKEYRVSAYMKNTLMSRE
ncbi:hypothetical protein CEE37_09580 [candidate division LCP-89 bacterium B3_LCP]|uniref:Uncharacterized protein n=1 Tax=candidate division LCP-89 bacterium B3_LCP TaxID=2012998 RepID=A0A532UZ00_UNCL8|nr:MAG: hypothetical protein CEE37_09580 [candidate division LCP-89 bacterium B3_LCP]